MGKVLHFHKNAYKTTQAG